MGWSWGGLCLRDLLYVQRRDLLKGPCNPKAVSHPGGAKVGRKEGQFFREHVLKSEYISIGFFFFFLSCKKQENAPIPVSLPGVVLLPYKSFVTEAPYF